MLYHETVTALHTREGYIQAEDCDHTISFIIDQLIDQFLWTKDTEIAYFVQLTVKNSKIFKFTVTFD